MKIKDYKCKCGHNDFFFVDKDNQKGIYCSYCGKWIKWADKDEQNLAKKQAPVLDKIRGELIQSIQNGFIKIESGKEELFHIIDKYRAESES